MLHKLLAIITGNGRNGVRTQQLNQGIANLLAGGEGLFLATLTGPGRIWLHSMTVSKMAHRLMEYMPAKKD